MRNFLLAIVITFILGRFSQDVNAAWIKNENAWVECADDSYSGIQLLMPAEAEKLSLSSATTHSSLKKTRIGGYLHIPREAFNGLDAIYVGGYFKGGIKSTYCTHLLAFREDEVGRLLDKPESLLLAIQYFFRVKGKEMFCSEIKSSDTFQSAMYFTETCGRGTTAYFSWKAKDYIYLYVSFGANDYFPPKLHIIEQNTDQKHPSGKPMNRQKKSEGKMKQGNRKTGDSDWVIGSVLGILGLIIFSTIWKSAN